MTDTAPVTARPGSRLGSRAGRAALAGRTATMSCGLLGPGSVEITYTPRLAAIPAASTCSALVARGHRTSTAMNPAAATTRQADPKKTQGPAGAACGGASEPNSSRMVSQVTRALCPHWLTGAILVFGDTIR